jgi:short-subunit dehydrogenase
MKFIIIGATSGLGRGTAELLAKDGHIVGITGRRKKLLKEIQSLYPTTIFIETMDVTENNCIKKLELLIDKMQGVDVILYSSGIGTASEIIDYEIENQTNQVNVYGFTQLIDYTYNYFVKQGYGHLAVISSVAGFRGLCGVPSYSASKGYQRIYLESLAQTAHRCKHKLTFTTIIPGFVDTDLIKENYPLMLSCEKAVKIIYKNLLKKKRIIYVNGRWRYIVFLMKRIPIYIWERML